MASYIETEKLKAEIQRRLEVVREHGHNMDIDKDSFIEELEDILLFIKSIEQDHDVNLEVEIDNQWDAFVSSEGEVEDFERIAKHFYDLGRKEAIEKGDEYMNKVEEYIERQTIRSINANGRIEGQLTPNDVREVAKIAREEAIEATVKWFKLKKGSL